MATKGSAFHRSTAFLNLLKSRTDNQGTQRFDAQLLRDVQIKVAEVGRLVCTMTVPSHLTNGYDTLHGGAIATLVDCISTVALITMGGSNTGFSIDLNVTYVSAAKLHEEVEIESKVLKLGKNIVMLSVEMRKADGGQLLASGRHTKYLSPASMMSSKL